MGLMDPNTTLEETVLMDMNLTDKFERALMLHFMRTGALVIDKNRKYGDSYNNRRVDARTLLENDKAPFLIHILEKVDRFLKADPGDTEDPLVDIMGYAGLEWVCRLFDDLRLNELH
jgi:hypothetical protein